MSHDTYTEKKRQWLEEVRNYCQEFALEAGSGFYVFQTPSDQGSSGVDI